ncbi:MAG TPA: MATE family efflux transporter, partial [Anaerovoracaceae bacterium]|nr:MATE family efflux transporter [Anaerovoracaceae bacterium]
MSQKTYDLTEGGILRKLLLVAVPIMGIQLMQMAYNLTDMFWLGRMETSVTAVAASGLAGMFLWLSVAMMLIGRTGAEIGTAQNLGRKDIDAARGYAEDSVRISLILG